jgi:outer membrane protein assembly factor BamB
MIHFDQIQDAISGFIMIDLKKRQAWLLICMVILIIFTSEACLVDVPPKDEYGFSNLELDKGLLWFGAGYKLYRVDLDEHTAKIVYDTHDIVITFVKIDGNNIFFGGFPSPKGSKGMLWSLEKNTERINWKLEVSDNAWHGYIVAPPLIANNILIIATRLTLKGIDKSRGSREWEIGPNWFGTGELLTPSLINGQLLFGVDDSRGNSSDQTIAIANPVSGKIIRSISMPGRLGAIPVLHGDCLFIKDLKSEKRDDHLYPIDDLRLNCVDISSGKIKWTFHGIGIPEQSMIAFSSGLVFDVFANHLNAIDEETGLLRWQSPELDGAARNPQLIDNLKLIALEIPRLNEVVFLDSETGDVQGEKINDVLSSPVVIGQEIIYGIKNAIVLMDIPSK